MGDREPETALSGPRHVVTWEMDQTFTLVRMGKSVDGLLGLKQSALLENPKGWTARVSPSHRKRYERTVNLVRDLAQPMDIDYRARLPGDSSGWLRDYIGFDEATGHFQVITVKIEAERSAEERLGFLNKAGRILGSSLDSRDLLARLAEVIVDSLADVCVIEVEQRGEILATVKSQRRSRWLAELESLGAVFLGSRKLPVALSRGRPVYLPTLSSRQAKRILGESRLRVMAKKPPHTAVIVPISARGRLLGAITLLCSEPGRQFLSHDVELAMELGRRAGTALENAELFEAAVQARDSLELDNEMKDEFLGILSHEIRTPLTVINGVARILPRLLPPLNEETQTLVNDMVSASERTVHLMDDLMLMARLNFGEQPQVEAIAADSILKEISLDFVKLFPDRTLSTDDSCPIAVAAAKPFLKQTLLNLLSNAHKYSPPKAKINLSASLVEKDVVFTVADSGNGVPEEELELIFDRFYRSANSAGVPGTGLGLRICKRFTEAQGGRIWASNSEQRGLVVSVALPRG